MHQRRQTFKASIQSSPTKSPASNTREESTLSKSVNKQVDTLHDKVCDKDQFHPPKLFKVVSSEGVNIREGVELSSKLIMTIPMGTLINVVEERLSSQGIPRVRLSNGTGWTSVKSSLDLSVNVIIEVEGMSSNGSPATPQRGQPVGSNPLSPAQSSSYTDQDMSPSKPLPASSEALPSGWSQRESKSRKGSVYYVNEITGETQWGVPVAAAAASVLMPITDYSPATAPVPVPVPTTPVHVPIPATLPVPATVTPKVPEPAPAVAASVTIPPPALTPAPAPASAPVLRPQVEKQGIAIKIVDQLPEKVAVPHVESAQQAEAPPERTTLPIVKVAKEELKAYGVATTKAAPTGNTSESALKELFPLETSKQSQVHLLTTTAKVVEAPLQQAEQAAVGSKSRARPASQNHIIRTNKPSGAQNAFFVMAALVACVSFAILMFAAWSRLSRQQ